MTVRFVPIPPTVALAWPSRREGGLSPDLLAACLTVSGVPDPAERLRAPGALVVTTGQQPGLFTGPLYTIYKALSTAALARLLESRWGRTVVPVFWVAGDDHDFVEAGQASWSAADGSVVTHTLRARSAEAPLTPMYQEALGPEVEAAVAALAAALPPSEFRDFTLGWIGRHFRPDATVSAGFGGALAELLAPLGIVCLDATHAAVKRTAAPYLIQALRAAPSLERDLTARAAELIGAGEDPGVTVGDGAALVMIEGRLGRDRLVQNGGGFMARRSGERFQLAELERVAAETPGRLSPNVLLRPVVESALLPTIAYVAGPAELRYLRLAAPIYQRMQVVPQLPVARWSGLLVEPRVDRVLEKFGASLEELMQPDKALESRVIRAQLPQEVMDTLTRLRQAIEEAYGVVQGAAVAVDPTLEKPVQNIKHQALAGTQDIEKRLLQHLRKRQETEVQQIARARAAVLPLGKPQERILTLAPFLARYGPGILGELLATMGDWYRGGLEGARLPS